MDKILCIMGGSGSGKTTLAKKLQEYNQDKYERVVECTTRPRRNDEVEGYDYFFLSDAEYDERKANMVETVETQFLPYRYGAEISYYDDKKWYILVVSIEGYLSLLEKYKNDPNKKLVLVNIVIDTNLDIAREKRNPLEEQDENLRILDDLVLTDNMIIQILNLSKLKTFRNNKNLCLKYFDRLCE